MKLIMIGLLLLMLGSCSLLHQSQSVAEHDFGYSDSSSQLNNSKATQQSSITVEAPKWLSDNRIRYRLLYAIPSQVRFYSLDRWIAPPPELFEQLFNDSEKQWLKPFTIQLQVFEQQFEAPDRAKVIMDFTASFVQTESKQKINERDFHLQAPCPTPDAKGAVAAFTLLTRKAVDETQAWLREVESH